MAASLGPSPWTHLQVVPSAHRSCGRASHYSRNLGISMGIFKVDVSKKLADFLKKKLKFSWFLKLIYIVSKSCWFLVDFLSSNSWFSWPSGFIYLFIYVFLFTGKLMQVAKHNMASTGTCPIWRALSEHVKENNMHRNK